MGVDIAGIGAIADMAGKIADKIFPDKTQAEKDAAALQMQEVMNEFKLATAQTDINLEEAKSTNWFVAGWRPFIGWICGTGLAYQFVIMPIGNAIAGHIIFASLDVGTLLNCLGGLLGLGAMRTVEKIKDVHGNH